MAWYAKDKDGNPMLWDCDEKPRRLLDSTWACDNHRGVGYLNNHDPFPEHKWEDEPIEVVILPKPTMETIITNPIYKAIYDMAVNHMLNLEPVNVVDMSQECPPSCMVCSHGHCMQPMGERVCDKYKERMEWFNKRERK